MKKLDLLPIILFCIPFLSFAQEGSLQVSKNYKSWVTMFGGNVIKGTLYQVNDSSVLIANSVLKTDLFSGKYQITKLNYNEIITIDTRAVNHVGRGALLGAFGGLLSGALIGILAGNGHNDGGHFYTLERAELGGFLGILPGTLIGTISGLSPITIPINGRIDNFNKNRERLKKYTYKH